MPVPIGARRHRVLFENPTSTVADGDGGVTQTWFALTPPQMWMSIRPASARELERVAAGAVVQSQASHLVTGPYHAGVTTQTRMTYAGRVFQVTGKANIDETGAEMVLTCVEVVA